MERFVICGDRKGPVIAGGGEHPDRPAQRLIRIQGKLRSVKRVSVRILLVQDRRSIIDFRARLLPIRHRKADLGFPDRLQADYHAGNQKCLVTRDPYKPVVRSADD